MDPDKISELLEAGREKLRREERRKLSYYKPYGFQLKFHEACASCQQVLLMAANRVGKTYCGAAEMAYHLTGLYPEGWKGRRFKKPIKAWAAGTTNDKTRDILQAALLGDPKDPGAFGTGSVPGDLVVGTTRKPGIPNALSAFAVKHVSGGNSVLGFKSYEMGAEAFMGEALDVVWLDEEPPEGIYSQCLARILDKKGLEYMTFTPESGMTSLVARLVNDPKPGQAIIHAAWDDAPHLDEDMKRQILEALPEHERDMRSKGIPMLGSGLVFPVPEADLYWEPTEIPEYFPHIAGMDFGWDHPTACVWGLWDRDTDTFYVYDIYRKSQQTIPLHASAIRARGEWIPVAWPHDGEKHDSGSGDGLASQYRKEKAKMLPHHFTNPPGPGQKEGEGGNSREDGIQAMLTAMQTGRFKVAKHLTEWFQEFRMYHRKDGMIVALNDDLMSATRYAFQSRRFARVKEPRRTQVVQIADPLARAWG